MTITTQSRPSWLNGAALLLVFPAAFVILISILKYGLGIHGPFEASAPFLESWGIKEPFGFNINLLIILGPVAAIILCAMQLLQVRMQMNKEQFRVEMILRRKWAPITIGLFSLLVMGILFIYMIGENCNCY